VSAYLQLTITDTLGVWANARVIRTFWYRLPPHWVADGTLVPGRRDQLVNAVYGPGRRDFVLLDVQEKVLTEREARAKPWLSDLAGFYVCADDSLREVIPAEL
jgi:hypothetical protein